MEEIIKSKLRVQKHGEVFTPKRIVNKMLNIPEIKRVCEELTDTFLEPSAGEGAFLVAILNRKLNMVSKKYNNSLKQYENYSLLVLSSLYGIELLEDNAQNCVMNMFETFYDMYLEQIEYHDGKVNKKVLESAKEIISSNIRQGDFLKKLTALDKPIIFSQWEPLNLNSETKNIKIQRTEYTLEEIYSGITKQPGTIVSEYIKNDEQLNLFDLFENEESEEEDLSVNEMRYISTTILNVYKEEMEDIYG